MLITFHLFNTNPLFQVITNGILILTSQTFIFLPLFPCFHFIIGISLPIVNLHILNLFIASSSMRQAFSYSLCSSHTWNNT